MAPLRNLITDIHGIRVGHAQDTDVVTGVTAVLIDRPNVAAARVGGGAPGTRQMAILDADTINADVDAIVLSGGSAFGLDAAGGVMAALARHDVGFAVGPIHVPIVAQAIVFDLLSGGWPPVADGPFYWHLGREAASNAAGGAFALGSVGGGTGATTVNLKGGVGSASVRLDDGITVAALTVVNAIGTTTVGDGRHFWAAPFERAGEFGGHGPSPMPVAADLALSIKGGAAPPPSTTISLVATDASLTKAECKRVAIMAQAGLAHAIRPALAPMDGDVIFAVARQQTTLKSVAALTAIGQAAADCLARAIARGVYEAAIPSEGYAGPPAYIDRHGRRVP